MRGCANIASFIAGATTTGAPLATTAVVSRSLARPDAARAIEVGGGGRDAHAIRLASQFDVQRGPLDRKEVGQRPAPGHALE